MRSIPYRTTYSYALASNALLMKRYKFTPSESCIFVQVIFPSTSLLVELERLFARFFWSKTSGQKIHWSSWKNICFPSLEGGLGIRRLSDVATAFSYKLWWRVRENYGIWSRFMVEKYTKSHHFYTALNARYNLKCGNICVRPLKYLPIPNLPVDNLRVCDFFMHDDWNVDLLHSCLHADVVSNIVLLHIDLNGHDVITRKHTPDVMQSRGTQLASKCQCCFDMESIQHVFINGSVASQVWDYFTNLFGVKKVLTNSPRFLLSVWVNSSTFCGPGHLRGWELGRDADGKMVFNFYEFIGHCTNTESEMRALIRGLELCDSFGCSNVLVEVDSQVLCSVLKVNHIYREANQVADYLANLGCDSQESYIFHPGLVILNDWTSPFISHVWTTLIYSARVWSCGGVGDSMEANMWLWLICCGVDVDGCFTRGYLLVVQFLCQSSKVAKWWRLLEDLKLVPNFPGGGWSLLSRTLDTGEFPLTLLHPTISLPFRALIPSVTDLTHSSVVRHLASKRPLRSFPSLADSAKSA
ncbi:hypothetical protein RD792_017845 [Penstemon davidsonii]|uniref:RNase H type-1 domain-containing protein n=1 Tax=Penstemon davidsonii TaxID=160366 RepID=A0ABR0DVN9_9LAMI|nr:hypothetical protein RD792_017845 [Penstemon davidsonii]